MFRNKIRNIIDSTDDHDYDDHDEYDDYSDYDHHDDYDYEDYVYDDINTTKGQQICAGINNLFTEVIWWYPTANSTFNDRYVVYNYGQDNANLAMGNWYTGVNTNSIRTTWNDSLVNQKT